MKLTHTLAAVSLIFCFNALLLAQEGFVDGVNITTTKAPWTLRILGNDLDITNVEAKPDNASAYFMMTSESTKLNVSVFIEPIDKCKSGQECRDYVLGLGNPAWGKFEQLSKGKLKDFSYFEFYRPEVQGRPVKMLDMYAEYASQGYWVDLHISKVLYSKSDHALFEKVVNSVAFLPKSGASADRFDNQLEKASSAASLWLELWDSEKCKESYAALSSLTRADTSEASWVDYCTRLNKTIGPRSRDLIAAAFTSALPGKTQQPVAVLAYHTSSEFKQSFIEIVALIVEKNGAWTITNYLPQ
jgi:hypothetical protein